MRQCASNLLLKLLCPFWFHWQCKFSIIPCKRLSSEVDELGLRPDPPCKYVLRVPSSTLSFLSFAASTALATVNEDAKLCDDAIGSLQKARSKAEARNRSKFAETTISDRQAGCCCNFVSFP